MAIKIAYCALIESDMTLQSGGTLKNQLERSSDFADKINKNNCFGAMRTIYKGIQKPTSFAIVALYIRETMLYSIKSDIKKGFKEVEQLTYNTQDVTNYTSPHKISPYMRKSLYTLEKDFTIVYLYKLNFTINKTIKLFEELLKYVFWVLSTSI